MGVYDRSVITTSDESERITELISVLNNLNPDPENPTVISAEQGTLDIGNDTYTGVNFSFVDTDISGFFGYFSLPYTGCQLKIGENTNLIDPVSHSYMGSANLAINSYIDDNCTYLAIKDLQQQHGGVEVMILKLSETKTLIGYKDLYNVASEVTYEVADISALTFKDISNIEGISYTYTDMFPYTAAGGTIDFLAQSYFVNGGVRKFQSNFLRECSTITLKSTASLPDGNYVALGAHCLAPLDEEVEE